MPGVDAVYTGADIAKASLGRCRSARRSRRRPHHAVAVDKVRYAGEPVAVVVASDRYVARDAADAIVVDVRPAAGGRRSRGGDDRHAAWFTRSFANNLAVALVPSGTGVAPTSTVDNTAVDKAFADAES